MKISLLHWDSGTSPVMNPQTDVVWQWKGWDTARERERRHRTWQTDRVQLIHLSYVKFKSGWVKGGENSLLMANIAASSGHVKIKLTCWLVSSSGTSHAEMSHTWLAYFIGHFSSPPIPQVLYSIVTISIILQQRFRALYQLKDNSSLGLLYTSRATVANG